MVEYSNDNQIFTWGNVCRNLILAQLRQFLFYGVVNKNTKKICLLLNLAYNEGY